ncbi:hypothetical protein SQ03_10550 [Methylobacterium platani JCM 14648]|uniref:Uncharacterized protein n=2 Tax=Methylobacterium platani TaxID=427683 RepID=A0A179SE95_9HYPH|nr:hypothetical protein SQ03_10550 [Methylobacterium platani JCM 14648]OAS24806.1 hypothetical protein A5481_11940 [Methylobacterium platani]
MVISAPWCITASVRQPLRRRPLTIIVQAPHWPWSQPFFEPVRCRCSRIASSRLVRRSRSSSRRSPFTVKATRAVTGASRPAGTARAASGRAARAAARGAVAEAPAIRSLRSGSCEAPNRAVQILRGADLAQ